MTKYNYNEPIFATSNDISYYLLGCYLTDGGMYNNTFEITSKDKDWLEVIQSAVCPEKSIEISHEKYWRFRGTNKVIASWLREHNCVPNKSLIVEFPTVPQQYLPDLIRGLIDGDGSISITRNTIYLCSASYNFIQSFIKALTDNKINNHFYQRKDKTSTIRSKDFTRNAILYKVSIYGKDCYKFLKWIYYHDNVLCMPRKHKLAKTIIDTFEERGLTLDNLERFDTNKNKDSNKLKINNHDLLHLLEKWRAIPEDMRNKWGAKKKFYQENIAGIYKLRYNYFNRLLRGIRRKNITT